MSEKGSDAMLLPRWSRSRVSPARSACASPLGKSPGLRVTP
jgi:hypothetical protein